MIREPAVAGMFYYFDKANLEKQLSKLFSNVQIKEECFGVVSPHAGYIYSGKTAAFAIGSLKRINKFVILGPNHSLIGPELSIMGKGFWRTPLGECKIDSEIAKYLLEKCEFLKEDSSAHIEEHSIEVQLPFLQYKFKNFSFVPICIENVSYSEEFLKICEKLGKAIAQGFEKFNFNIIASSDFSHYMPFKTAEEKDKKVFKYIEKLDLKGFFKTLEDIGASVCGYGPIAVLMSAAKNLNCKEVKLIHYSSSGDQTGDYGSVVTYAAIGFKL